MFIAKITIKYNHMIKLIIDNEFQAKVLFVTQFLLYTSFQFTWLIQIFSLKTCLSKKLRYK